MHKEKKEKKEKKVWGIKELGLTSKKNGCDQNNCPDRRYYVIWRSVHFHH